jgi:hypothetical protein
MHPSIRCKSCQAIFALFAVFLFVQTGTAYAQHIPVESATKIDQSVLSTLQSLYGTTSTVVAHSDLTAPFKTTSQWTLVIAKETDRSDYDQDPAGNSIISVCFVKIDVPDCSEKAVLEKYREHSFDEKKRPFYQFFDSKIVYLDSEDTRPLLLLRTCSYGGLNGNCGKATFLYEYDRKTDDFHSIFFNISARSNNEETRFVEKGPLIGSVIVVYPTSHAPYTYSVEVYKRHNSEGYTQVLRYRGKTVYNDGNRLPVIDSEMPEILQHLGMWKPGVALPNPAEMPSGCTRLSMRNGVEWCD